MKVKVCLLLPLSVLLVHFCLPSNAAQISQGEDDLQRKGPGPTNEGCTACANGCKNSDPPPTEGVQACTQNCVNTQKNCNPKVCQDLAGCSQCGSCCGEACTTDKCKSTCQSDCERTFSPFSCSSCAGKGSCADCGIFCSCYCASSGTACTASCPENCQAQFDPNTCPSSCPTESNCAACASCCDRTCTGSIDPNCKTTCYDTCVGKFGTAACTPTCATGAPSCGDCVECCDFVCIQEEIEDPDICFAECTQDCLDKLPSPAAPAPCPIEACTNFLSSCSACKTCCPEVCGTNQGCSADCIYGCVASEQYSDCDLDDCHSVKCGVQCTDCCDLFPTSQQYCADEFCNTGTAGNCVTP